MIAERAYLLSTERGFEPGGQLEDWLRAEREVNPRLAGRRAGRKTVTPVADRGRGDGACDAARVAGGRAAAR
jgi:hypothetical protein